jgi:hypothetical protein
VISITETSAQQLRPVPVVFPQGQMSLPLVEASTARLLNLMDGQVVQGTVQAQGDQLALLLRGRLLELPPGMDWTIGQRLNLRAQTNPDGSLTLNRLPTPGQGKSAGNASAGTSASGGAAGASAAAGGARSASTAAPGAGIDPALAARQQSSPQAPPSSVPAGNLYPPPAAPPQPPSAPGAAAAPPATGDSRPQTPAAAPGSSAQPVPTERSAYAGPAPMAAGNVSTPLASAAMAQGMQAQPANAGALAQQQVVVQQPARQAGAPRMPPSPDAPAIEPQDAEPGSSAYAPTIVPLPPLPERAAPLSAPSVARVDAPTVQAMGLKDGQVLQASVQARDGSLGFVVDGRVLPTLQPGSQDSPLLVNLRVEINQDGSATLHNLLAPAAKPTTAAPPLALAPVSLSGVLATVAEEEPQRVTLGPQDFFSRLGSLLFRANGLPELVNLFNSGTLDAVLRQVGRPDLQAQWSRQRLSMAQLSPREVRSAVQAALGSERNLLNGVGNDMPTNDTKQLLLSALASMGALDELSGADLGSAQQLQRGVDDLESAQVRAVQAQTQQELVFNMVIPFRDASPVEIQFERRRTSEGRSTPFTVNVHSTSADYGELWLKTELLDKDRVDLMMWARNAAVVDMAQSGAANLGAQLQAAGIAMRSFQVIHGERPGGQAGASQEPPVSALAGAVLDIRA